MNVAIIGINDSLLDLSNQNEVVDYIKFNIIREGINVSLLSYFNNNIENLQSTMQQSFDVIFYIGTNNMKFNFEIKQNISKLIREDFQNNISIQSNIKNFCELNKIEYSSEYELVSYFPSNSQILNNINYNDFGFIYSNNNKLIVMLPSNINYVRDEFNNTIKMVIDKKTDNIDNTSTTIIRCYGVSEDNLRSFLSDEINNPKLQINIINISLDNIINIKYKNSDIAIVQPVIADICSKLSKIIYSTEDTNLYETAINLLNIQRKKIVIAETITQGFISNKLIKLDSEVVEKSIITTLFDSIAKQLKLNEKIVNQFGKYSVNTVYELDNLLLEQSSANISVFVLGDSSNDTCYIAVGDIDGIHVYKNKFTSIDNYKEVLSNTTMFYLIKKLRQKDLQFV